MPLPRFQRLDAGKRAALLRTAAKVFAEKGFERASLNGILAAAGLGKSSYYYYFADKEDLLVTVLEDLFHQIERESARPDLARLDATNFWPELEAWSARSVRVTASHPEVIALAREALAIFRSPEKHFPAFVAEVMAEYRALLLAGRKLGCVRADIDVDWLVAITRAADQAVDERFAGTAGHWDLAEHIRIAFDVFRRLVEARK